MSSRFLFKTSLQCPNSSSNDTVANDIDSRKLRSSAAADTLRLTLWMKVVEAESKNHKRLGKLKKIWRRQCAVIWLGRTEGNGAAVDGLLEGGAASLEVVAEFRQRRAQFSDGFLHRLPFQFSLSLSTQMNEETAFIHLKLVKIR